MNRTNLLLALPLLTLPWLAGCGLFDSNPGTFWEFEPCILGCGKPAPLGAEALAPTVAFADLRGGVAAEAARLAGQPADFVGVHAPTGAALDDFLGQLAAHGLHYEVAASAAPYVGADPYGLPSELRDLVLAPAGSAAGTSGTWVGDAAAGLFAQTEPGPDGLTLERGWASVDVDTPAGRYRILTARLDTASAGLRAAWTSELEAGPANTDRIVLRAIPEVGAP
jgi:hypothetical protein